MAWVCIHRLLLLLLRLLLMLQLHLHLGRRIVHGLAVRLRRCLIL